MNTLQNIVEAQSENYAAMQHKLRGMVADRITRDLSVLTCQNALRRSRNYNADFLKASYAQLFVDYDVNVNVLFDRCDKTLDRFCKVTDQIFNHDTLSPTGSSDQYRYTVNLIRTLVKAYASEVTAISKSDLLATGSKRKTDNDFVSVASRLMCDSTAERQTGIAAKVLTDLGFCNATFNGKNMTGLKLNSDSVIFAKLVQMIADGK